MLYIFSRINGGRDKAAISFIALLTFFPLPCPYNVVLHPIQNRFQSGGWGQGSNKFYRIAQSFSPALSLRRQNIILSHELQSSLTISLRPNTHKSLLLENLDPSSRSHS
ncbi:hypothetical protein MiSe_74040 [Microseira wollei NIES-4236]|uniref:Uncharacterized protein n=1 Tax=Microseira wollei NIES-4236 TaxID=2530354 RepID=A0AAV3XM02_9CYAN|nr:hypothetical protein MiSe_74040 [Microseira wollei NIES-4236]